MSWLRAACKKMEISKKLDGLTLLQSMEKKDIFQKEGFQDTKNDFL